ncbi:glutamate synthase [NADPH] large chain [Fragilariopsis cylindrus CCMP1102]|uniref:Glutamate synthase [NADH] n=1 Tax=Fragilariopsis cylindrus CCMP1102 TaxID=635003 RepID=A0A1E7FRF6_9STRA|nr:glutamate synthase [NADPH] large chain [Fragilariopsis cylindrus CCMP1102]|eukprot:OEU20685.1 glutamate synthase [NADPH] large chain [Fragilariopsis cylindrus CCMP1102]
MKSIPSRHVVEVADEMLVRMAHRGGCGCDPASGDGAGILYGMPDSFMRTKAKELFGAELPAIGEYAVGNVFFPPGSDTKPVMDDCKAIMERLVKERGLNTVGWRRVPVDNSMLGKDPLDSEPITEQIFLTVKGGLTAKDRRVFEQDLLLVRKMAEEEATDMLGPESGFYINSLTTNHITYKGQLTPEQVSQYYHDLVDPTFTSHLALVHSRFSTNTFPSWERAQPIRMMCHNGEINTLRGNKNWMYSRGGIMESPIYGNDTPLLLPAVSDHMSDSGNFDSVLELLTKASNRSLPESVMMMIPEAWQGNDSLSDAKKSFYEYNSCVMEPWDGPAMVAFTDSRYIGATLDRNGLRPSRYYVTKDDHVILSSEIGVSSELPDSEVKIKHRLEPGKMFLLDFETQRIVPDDEIKEQIAAARPYAEWVENGTIDLEEWAENSGSQADPMDFESTNRKLNMFGYSSEKLDMLLLPMAIGRKEALGSMGNDAALAVLSEHPRQVNDYFKQLFAQVTNPPIDPIREEIVMSLVCPVGPEGNLLADSGPEHTQRLVVKHPVLTLEEMATLKGKEYKNSDGTSKFNCATIDTTFPVGSGVDGMLAALERICDEAADAIQGGKYGEKGVQGVILSDKFAGPDRMALPSLLSVGAVHHHLIGTKQRPKAAIFAEVGDAKEVHDFATIFGYGCDGVCPYMAYEVLCKMNEDGMVEATAKKEVSNKELIENYRYAAGKGLMKVMSKMGISTLQSYKGAQVFEAVGLADEVVDRCFTGTTTRIQGTDFEAIYRDLERFHEDAFPLNTNENSVLVRSDGQFHYRDGGEAHLNTPASMVNLQIAGRTGSREAYKEFSRITNEQNKKVTLRGQLKFKFAPSKAIPLDEVEPVSEIVKRFATGAMSLGSISQEAHETLAVAMNTLGGRSNTGEGGEDPKRFADNRRSSIKQVASGRFGVTSNYLANSDQIQIKMAQGAKPGEGGELPGFKVSEYIGKTRHTTPGVGLISPPPHHDIYSIEDLAQLIHDLKNAQPTGEVSVKLVSEVGVGVVAAGVAKALADHITISGHDGGTGAAAWTGVKGCGLPWELGLAETQQTLVLNGLRDRVKVQTDGQLKTGRDVAIACLLGAEEFGFATAPLITLGCIMMRKCHLNTCPVGVATQDPELRKKFTGQPEHVVNYFFLLAEEVREIMARLGYRKMEDMIGQTQHLDVNRKGQHYKSRGLDLSPLLTPASELNPSAGIRNVTTQYHGLDLALDNKFIAAAQDALDNKNPVVISERIENINRSLGTMLSYEISKRHGGEGLPDDTITLNLEGKGGQSFGFTLAKGITANIIGDANDYTGKGLSGGKISVFPSKEVVADGFKPEDHVVVGNVCLYGATSGKAFFNGKAGERFCVRNSGALAVVEGVGDHGCEYMTGGIMVCLGETGRNFAAGMSGGISYVYDPEGKFPARCNMELVGLEKIDAVDEKEEIFGFIQEHVSATGSSLGARMLEDWDHVCKDFVKVYPHDFKRVVEERARAAAEAEAA